MGLRVPFGLALVLVGLVALPASAQETVDQAICRMIEAAARAERIPAAFLTRLIWQESSFRPDVVSRAGAQGIAQFMPGTARERGLADPFDPEAAIPASAALLADLARRFGNLGLAAAAYNAGPDRVRRWLDGRAGLPSETVAYVARITGRSAEDWSADRLRAGRPDEGGPPAAPGSEEPAPGVAAGGCLVTLAAIRKPDGALYQPRTALDTAPLAPWGVQIAGNFSKARALASFDRTRARHGAVLGPARPMVIGTRLAGRGTRPFYRVRLGAPSRTAAETLCAALRRAGGSCIVLKT